MSDYSATINWQRGDDDFLGNKYSRAHSWEFDGGVKVPASASPHIVPPPWSRRQNVDPEEAFVASLSSCHMLFYLSIAAAEGYQVDSYIDKAVGVMARNEAGRIAVTEVVLNPVVEHSGVKSPDPETQRAIHHRAHEACFIANSVKTRVSVKL